MSLKEILKKEFFVKYNKLTAEELAYLEETPFQTETCAECSKFHWADYRNRKIVIDSNGEIPICNGEEMDFNPGMEKLTPEEASYYFGNDPFGTCKNYDGPIFYTKNQIETWIEKRDEIIKKVAGEQFLEEYKETVRV